MLVTLVTMVSVRMAFVAFCVSLRPFGDVLVVPELLNVAWFGWLEEFIGGADCFAAAEAGAGLLLPGGGA